MRRIGIITLVASFLVVASLWPHQTQAQGGCDRNTLKEAEKNYDIGRFEEVINGLTPCLEKGFSRKEKVEGYRLLSMTYLALDNLDKAAESTEKLLDYDPLFDPSIQDPQRFTEMVKDIKSGKLTVQVTSVSKKAENILEAPATVVMVTEKEIKERGYMDLIDLLTDLPGFDLSKIYGATYTNIYQRGFRQNNTERTLFLIDGVEENDLWSNIAYISRQYPLSNIKRVEVIYGPASTMYGPNAFVGVINVITKDPEDITGDEKNIGITGQAGYGSFNTRFADVTIGGRKKNIGFTLTGRVFQSDEMDLSSDPYYDYDKAEYDEIDYRALLSLTQEDDPAAFLEENELPMNHPFYNVRRAPDSTIIGIDLTPAGAQAARNHDKSGYDQELEGSTPSFSNHTNDWLINGKMNIGELTLGFQTWRREEGATTFFTDMNEAGSENGSIWVPKFTFFYANYEKQLSDKLILSSLTNYRTHEVDESSRAVYVLNYTNGNTLADLVDDVEPLWVNQYFYEISKQLRSELKLLYTPLPQLDVISGVEVRNSQLQGNYLITFFDNDSPQDSGTTDNLGGNQFNIRDIGFYTQAAYRFNSDITLTLGGRVDNNRIRTSDGFGTEFSPRVVLVYTPGDFIFKGMYARGIQNVSNWTKFSETQDRVANGRLGPESIQNYEVSGAWMPKKPWSIDLAIYNAIINDVVELDSVRNDPELEGKVRNENIGTNNILGVQLNANYRTKTYTAYLNYTFTEPEDTRQNLRISDIASHQLNFGVTKRFFRKLNVNLRANYVGEREVGEGTTVAGNPDDFPGHFVMNSTIGYHNLIQGMTLQLVANNLLDEEYWHPGPRTATGSFYTSRVLQRERHFLLKLLYEF